MRVRNGVRVVVGLAVAAAAVVVPVGAANASPSLTTETYDAYANGGAGTQITASPTTSFTLDGLTYTTDQASTTWVSTANQGAPLSSGSGDGVLLMNYDGTPMTSTTINLANGDPMTVVSFDLDSFASTGTIELIPDGNPAHETSVAGSFTGHIDLSSNANFRGITTLELLDVGDSGYFTPTLNNFAYEDLNSPPSLTATGGSAAFVAGDNTTSTPVVVDSGITVADGDSGTAASATVSITGNFQAAQDVLAFTNTNSTTFGNISATYNATTGVLALTSAGATATIAQWQAALRAVTYTDTAVTPNTATRTVSFSLNDGLGDAGPSNTVTKTVTVTDTDQTPIVTTTGGTTNYIGSTSAVTVDGGISVSDLDNTTQASATVSVSGGFHSGDTLAFTNDGSTMGNVVASYNAATGVLTLTSAGATATDAQWANALSAVTFSSSSTTYGSRTIDFTTSDGTKTSSAATDTVDVLGPPTITTDSGSAAFVAGDNTASTPVVVDSGLTVTDGSSTTLASTTVAITGNFHSGEDVLAFTNDGATMGNVTASYNATTGVLTMTSAGATATLAQWQSALRSVSYTDTAVTPNTATRTISFTAVDGGGTTSNTATRTVTVTDTDQTPIVTTTGGSTDYVGGTTAVTIDGGITVSDLDNMTQSSATVSMTAGFNAGDTLAFTNTSATTFGNIVGSYNSATGVLTLTSAGATATDAQWASALRAVTFSSSSTTYGNRTIDFTTNDGTKTSSAATDTVDVLGPPTITTDSGSAAFVAGDNTASTPVVVDSGLTVTDGSSTTLASTTVAITGNFHSGEDVLAFTNDGATMGNVTASYNATTGVLTLTSAGATATLAQWQSALRSVSYTDTAVTPNTATRTISFTAVDGGGTTSNTATRTVTVTDTDQTPIVTTTGGSTDYVGGTTAVTIDGGITVSDLDNMTQSSATVSMTAGFNAGDTLAFTNTSSTSFGNVVGSYNSATGVLTLTSAGATASDAQWANALSAVTFSSSSTTYGSRTIDFATSDGTKTSSAATDTVDVLGPPTITTDSGSAAFVAGDNTASTPVVVDSGVTMTDGSSSTFASTTVAVTGNFHSGEDVLAFTNDGSTMGNIAAAYNATTGVLTMTSAGATATRAQWQSALESVSYTDTAVTPNNATRTISFTAVDGGGTSSNTATRTVTITDTDQTPIVTTTSATLNYVSGSSAATVDSGVVVLDGDNATQASASISITAGFSADDTLAFTNNSATTFGNITSGYNAATGVLTLTSAGATATNAQWANALSAVAFSSSSTTYGNRTISYTTDDGTKTSSAANDTVDVKAPAVVSPPAEPPAYPGISRVAGPDRIATAIAASEHEFPGPPSAFTANAVVLVDANDYIDGLTGAPLAAAVRAPLLFTDSDTVPAAVLSEIHRLLGSSGTVYLLGGTAAISASVETQLQGSGYTPQRIAGADRYATAVAIADMVAGVKGAPPAVFEVTGLGYADALTAAPAAARAAGVVLLTVGDSQSTATADWIGAHPGLARYALGGPAVAADPGAIAISGADRYATAVDVATRFFPSANTVSLANGTAWPDAAVAAVNGALNGAPLLLVTAGSVPSMVTSWFDANARALTAVTAYGGPFQVSSTVLGSIATMTGLSLA